MLEFLMRGGLTLANLHGGHKTSAAYVVSMTEDFCKSPTIPVGYMISQVLDVSDFTCSSVKGLGTPVLNLGSRVTSVKGNEAGVGGGVVSSVNNGMCKPVSKFAELVRAEGKCVLRHATEMEMNCATVDGPGNTRGILMYITPASEDASKVPPFTPIDRSLKEWMWVDIDMTDIATVAVAIAMSPIAFLIRPLASLFPETIGGLLSSLPKSSAGTGDKTGVFGPIIGNNSGGEGTPGMVGIAFSLAHAVMSVFGGDGGVKFEKGQGDEGHDGKTGVGFPSEAMRSFGETMGQLLGIAFRKLGELLGLPLGDWFYEITEFFLGPSTGYDFVGGVWKGTWQKAGPAGPMCF